jgi:hypothetical protein
MAAPGTAVAVQTPGPIVPMTFPQKVAYARELAESNLLPRQFQKQPASVLWAIEYGEALGLRGVIAMSGIHVIENKPAPSAAMAAGLIRARGHRLRVWVTPPTDQHQWGTAVAELVRRDDPDFTFRAEWGVEDAVRAEICQIKDGEIWHRTQNGKAGNWQKFPRQMMKARVLGEVCRDGATDVLIGLHYLAEEMEGAELDRNGEIVSSEPAPQWTPETDVRPVAEHTPDTVTDITDATVVVSGPITTETQGKMTRLFRKAGLGGDPNRNRRLRVSEILLSSPDTPRTITVASDLTEEDGRTVVDWLTLCGDEIGDKVETLLRDDDEERARDAAEEMNETMPSEPEGES